jgi:formylglycine-generating enzyme required for sulfatase activity
MKFVDGESLSSRLIREGALQASDVMRVGEEVCGGLSHAHSRGVIHRDVKPGNILLDRESGAMLTDFGIARAAWGTQLTAAGMSIGTPHYMSPEQVLGQDIDARCDLYSLATVLYELSTGTLPFRGEDPTALTHAQVYEPPEPPTVRKGDVPQWLESVILKGLAKRAEHRFQTAEEMGEALRTQKQVVVPPFEVPSRASSSAERMRRRDLVMVETGPPTPTDQTKRSRGERRASARLWVVLTAVVVLMAAAAGAYLFVQRAPQQEEKGKEMPSIPGGTFQMGSDRGDADEQPVHSVTVRAFQMDKYEVTNQEYRRFDPTHHSGEYRRHNLNGGEQPVVLVSWWDAVRYCNWRSRQEGLEECYDEDTGECDFSRNGYRLPTEAEWEFAARGGYEGTWYPWGDKISRDDANYDGVGEADRWYATAPAGCFPANGYGLHDIAGNVYEWCHDWYHEEYYARSPESDPVGPGTGTYRVLRGGSWSDYPSYLRCANRSYGDPAVRYAILGFRCVRSP